jgi:hypothetical protein
MTFQISRRGKEYLQTAQTLLRAAQTMTDRAIAGQLKALADDYERRAEKAARADAAKSLARAPASAEQADTFDSMGGMQWWAASLVCFCGHSAASHTSNLLALIGKECVVRAKSLAFALILAAAARLCSAQTILKSEPLALAPFEVAFMLDASCPTGKVLKVTGAMRGLDRKRVCVAVATKQGSPVTAIPQTSRPNQL